MVIERLDLACAGDPPVRPSPATHSPGCEVRHDPRRRQRARERAGRSNPDARLHLTSAEYMAYKRVHRLDQLVQ